MQLKLSSYLDRYVCISRNFSCFPIWIVTLSRAILAVLFRSLRLYLAQFYLSYFIRYVYISRNFICFFIWIVMFVSRAATAVLLFGLLRLYLGNYSCPLVWIVTFVSRATTAVLLFGLLRLYLGQLQLSSCLDCYICISRNSSCLLIWIVTFVSCTTLSRATKACFLFRSLRFYLLLFQLFSYLVCYVCLSVT